jgi:hypothetical protein
MFAVNRPMNYQRSYAKKDSKNMFRLSTSLEIGGAHIKKWLHKSKIKYEDGSNENRKKIF